MQGVSNHAGTTPINLRHDAGYVAPQISTYVRKLALEIGGGHVATVGVLELQPGQVNVVADRVQMKVDLRNLNEDLLQEAKKRLQEFAH